MRELKFRAWDRALSEMIDDIQDNQFINGDLVMGFGDYLSDSRYSVMQYTGLKDKNGNHLYEGDIIRQETEIIILSIDYGVVYFDEEDLWFKLKVFKNNASYRLFGDITILGNIHQNPELMEEIEK